MMITFCTSQSWQKQNLAHLVPYSFLCREPNINMKIIDFLYLLCANFHSNYSSQSPKGPDSLYIYKLAVAVIRCSTLSDKSRSARVWRHLSWENRQNPIHLCHQRHTRSRNSLVLFTPKLKGLINASLYSAQQNGHWTQSAAARRSAAVALLSLSVSAELALLNVSNPQYCRVRQASQTPTLFFSVKLIFSFIVEN